MSHRAKRNWGGEFLLEDSVFTYFDITPHKYTCIDFLGYGARFRGDGQFGGVGAGAWTGEGFSEGGHVIHSPCQKEGNEGRGCK